MFKAFHSRKCGREQIILVPRKMWTQWQKNKTKKKNSWWISSMNRHARTRTCYWGDHFLDGRLIKEAEYLLAKPSLRKICVVSDYWNGKRIKSLHIQQWCPPWLCPWCTRGACDWQKEVLPSGECFPYCWLIYIYFFSLRTSPLRSAYASFIEIMKAFMLMHWPYQQQRQWRIHSDSVISGSLLFLCAYST